MFSGEASMTEVSIVTPHHTLKAYLSLPRGTGRQPGVVVIHDIFGMTADLRRNTDWLAASGYVAVAPDLFSWGGRIQCLRATFRDIAEQSGQSVDDIDAVKSWIQRRDDCTGKVGIIGFCMGGAYALFMAPEHGFAVSSVNYGKVPKDARTIMSGACPIVGSFGARDRMLRGAAALLDEALTAQGIAHDVKEYPDAGHSFLNNHEGLLFKVVGGLMGAGYHAATEADARRRILAFFARYLRNQP
jgi:carboxymethylenebutenolidase